MTKVSLLATVPLLLMFGLSEIYAADQTLQYASITSVSRIIPVSSTYYTINPIVRLDGPYYVFQITSASGESFEVKGISELINTCHEISVIEAFRATPQGNEVWKGTKGYVGGVAKGTKGIVIHPGDAGAAMGETVARTGRTLGRAVTGLFKKDPKSSTGADLSKGAGGIAGEQARMAAYELHLNVYSKNPCVQDTLSSIAHKRWAGTLGVLAMGMVIPGSPLVARLIRGAVISSAYDDGIELMIRDNSAPELNHKLQEIAEDQYRFDKKSPEMTSFCALLDNPNYTPYQKAYVAFYVQHFLSTDHRADMLQAFASTTTVENAEILFSQLQLLCSYHRFIKPIRGFAVNRERVAGILSDGTVLLVLPYDYADDTKHMNSELSGFSSKGRSVELWLLGGATERFEAMAKKYNVRAIHCDMFNNPAFQSK